MIASTGDTSWIYICLIEVEEEGTCSRAALAGRSAHGESRLAPWLRFPQISSRTRILEDGMVIVDYSTTEKKP